MKKGFWITVKDIIRKVDVILEILDARMPELTRNKRLEDYTAKHNKPLILVINKVDLISKSGIKNLRSQYESTDYVLTTYKKYETVSMLIKATKKKVKKNNIKVAFIGYPNTGKSSLINALSKGGVAKTSAESGFTKGIQWITGKQGLLLYDTPGVIPYGERDEIKLGLMSGISPTKLEDPDLVAYELIKIFKDNSPMKLKLVYGLNPGLEPEEILEEFGKKRNILKKGGIVDEKRAAIQLILDWHKGKIRL